MRKIRFRFICVAWRVSAVQLATRRLVCRVEDRDRDTGVGLL